VLQSLNGQTFFDTIRRHTIAGFLIVPDSDSGGNLDGVGWKVIGREREHVFQPPIVGSEMYGRAPDHPAVYVSAMAFGFILRCLAKGDGLKLWVVSQLVSLYNLDLAVVEIRFGEVRPLLQNHDFETVARELGPSYSRREEFVRV
jgi:hypothetical protein